jgi:hypothetical protein
VRHQQTQVQMLVQAVMALYLTARTMLAAVAVERLTQVRRLAALAGVVLVVRLVVQALPERLTQAVEAAVMVVALVVALAVQVLSSSLTPAQLSKWLVAL